MWAVQKEVITAGTSLFKITKSGDFISYQDWVEYTQQSDEFIEFFIEVLSESSYDAFFWEVHPIKEEWLAKAFEFVLVESSTLNKIAADHTPFQQYFKTDQQVVSFPNLGGDAHLIVPTPISSIANYNHLATFIRKGPRVQVVQFWKKVAAAYQQAIGQEPKWLSTAGLGVSWLHVRIDSRPKYYRFNGYRVLNR